MSLTGQIDAVIAKINESATDPTPQELELIDILEQISTDLEKTKKDKTKAVQTPFFAFPDMNSFSEKLDRLTKAVITGSSLSTETTKLIVEAVKEIKVEVPTPQVSVTVPDVKIPPIKVPEVKVPETKIDFPSEMGLKKPDWLGKIVSFGPIINQLKTLEGVVKGLKLPRLSKDAIPVKLVYEDKVYRAGGGSFSASGGFSQPLPTDPNTNGDSVLTYDGAGNLTKIVKTIDSKAYTRTFSYDGSNNLITMSGWS